MRRNIYIMIILTNLSEIEEIDAKTMEVSLLVLVKNDSIFKIVSLRMMLASNYPKTLSSDTTTSTTTNMFM